MVSLCWATYSQLLAKDYLRSAALNLTPPTIERSTLELFDPHTWAVVDG